MLYYLLAAAIVLHTYFWGTGLAWLAGPRRWRGLWWALAPLFGWALQSAVVWAGAHTSLRGTNSYAWASELLPLALLAIAWRRRPATQWRSFAMVAGLMVAAGWTLLSPLVSSTRGLTSTSLGSCDQADYAAGARVFQEFARGDREGFLGLPEVTKVGSADTFFDFWLRLNHFTPSALIAHNGTILDCRPHELVSLSGVALVLLNLPMVLLLARVAVGLRGRRLLLVVAIYAFSPLTAYAVHHGALGQLYAAQGIAALALAAFGALRVAGGHRGEWAYAPVVLAAIWLLAGSYNFILTVALAPAAAWALAVLWLRGDAGALVRSALMVGAMGALCVALFWGRFDGLIERFQLFEQYNFGWAVPLLTPEGWVGIVRDTALHAWFLPARGAQVAVIIALWLAGVVALWRRGARGPALAALVLVLPVAAGWGVLAWEARTRANASYDAFKIISVFLPGLLAGLMCWLAAFRLGSRAAAVVTGLLAAAVLAANLAMAGQFRRQMMTPPLVVDRTLIELGRLETEPRVDTLNLRIDDFWARLWANYFLLRKPQYFSVHTYEGRLNTELKGDWDLSDSLLKSVPASAEDFVAVNNRFHLERVGAAGRIAAAWGDGWHSLEGVGNNRWRWSKGDAQVMLTNPSQSPLQVRLTLQVSAVRARRLSLSLDGGELGSWPVGEEIRTVVVDAVELPPGMSTLDFRTDRAAEKPIGDERVLSAAVYELKIAAQPAR
jgi:hypothetical protein